MERTQGRHSQELSQDYPDAEVVEEHPGLRNPHGQKATSQRNETETGDWPTLWWRLNPACVWHEQESQKLAE